MLAVPVGDTLGAVGTCPAFLADAGVWHHAEALATRHFVFERRHANQQVDIK